MKTIFNPAQKRVNRKRPLSLLLLAVISFAALAFLIYFFPPDRIIIPTVSFLTTLHVFFILFAIFLYAVGSYLFKNSAHGILIAVFAITALLFLLSELTHPFFFVLLAALFLTLELFVSYRK